MIETRVISLVILIAGVAVAVGVSQLLRMVARDIADRAKEREASEARSFD
ncbi:hypothetical protein [Amaricoccus sp. W119]